MRILITGCDGYIGKCLSLALHNKYIVIAVSRKHFDLVNSEETNNFFKNQYFDVVIHCAVKGGSRIKEDDHTVLDDNLRMYYNLIQNRSKYKKLISFGSGAEIVSQNSLYGLSKHIIRHSIQNNECSFNLRIYAVFDENELETRFIKSNIIRYINKKDIIVHQDRYMSFFYMQDLLKLVDYYINETSLQKEMNCCYSNILSLRKIAELINNLDNHKVNILVESEQMGEPYYNVNTWIPNIQYVGFENALKKVYNKILDQKI